MRGLIKPPPGIAVAYIDWEQQEFALAGGLSGDSHMIADYASGDVCWSFAASAGLIPPGVARRAKGQPKDDADHAHEAARDACKAVVLGLAYGKGWRSIAGTLACQSPWHKRCTTRTSGATPISGGGSTAWSDGRAWTAGFATSTAGGRSSPPTPPTAA